MIDILSTIHLDQTEEEEIQLDKTHKTIIIVE
jgi:hypothetical protein